MIYIKRFLLPLIFVCLYDCNSRQSVKCVKNYVPLVYYCYDSIHGTSVNTLTGMFNRFCQKSFRVWRKGQKRWPPTPPFKSRRSIVGEKHFSRRKTLEKYISVVSEHSTLSGRFLQSYINYCLCPVRRGQRWPFLN